MPLPEDLRQEYLQVLGITSYYPRLKLPGAPESDLVEWPQSWTEVTQQESNAGIKGNVGKVEKVPEDLSVKQAPGRPAIHEIPTPASLVRSASDNSTANEGDKSDIEIESTGSPGVNKPNEEYRLQLVCIRVNETLSILNAMPHLGPRQLPARHLNLLQNLLKIGGISHENLLVEEKPFHWPMVQGQQVDNSKNAAVSALMAYLQQKLADWQFCNLLVMGEQTITEMFAAENDDEQALVNIEDQDWQTYYTRSLDELLQRPVLKKELWQVIRKLKT
ncbi:MAG: hypothetical protein P8M72_13645 [Gammaproteobacteria bacterium]|nr:hypothetical protein [Gammaproteobacteria bacterium]